MQADLTDAIRVQTDSLLPFIGPILVYPAEGPGIENWITGGTGLLINTGTTKLLVTANHVQNEIEVLMMERELVVLLGRGSTFVEVTGWHVVDRNHFIDVCAIEVPSDFQESDAGFFHMNEWPPRLAQKGDQALILGFPAAHRVAHRKQINTRVFPILDFVTDVGPRRFTIADENDGREIVINPHNLEFPPHLGGMSGAPVFKVSTGNAPQLLGILSEAGDGLRGVYFCTHAQFLLPDGKLDLNRIPQL